MQRMQQMQRMQRMPYLVLFSLISLSSAGLTRIIEDGGVDGSMPGNSRLPEQLVISFRVEQRRVGLTLRRRQHADAAPLPLIVLRNGSLERVRLNSSRQFSLYADVSNMASFVVSVSPQPGAGRSFRGAFVLRGEEYEIRETAGDRGAHGGAQSDGGTYHVTKRPTVNGTFADDGREDLEQNYLNYSVTNIPSEDTPHFVYDPLPLQNVVQLLLFVDDSTYTRFYEESDGFFHEDRVNDAINNILFYYSNVINGVNMRFQSVVRHRSFSIQVELVGIVFSQYGRESPWKKFGGHSLQCDGRVPCYDVDDVLDSFEKWLFVKKDNLPQFDQATLVTSSRLLRVYSDGARVRIKGLGNIGSICDLSGGPRHDLVKSASVAEESGYFAVSQTVAHELAHNLGARHDGGSSYPANQCNSADQFVMAASPGQLTEESFHNPYKFSWCSWQYFFRTMETLAKRKSNCMLVRERAPPLLNTQTDVPGQRFDAHAQCKIIVASDSRYCGGHVFHGNICRRLQCYHPADGTCPSYVDRRAFYGTSCGDGQWCEAGECRRNPRAPRIREADYCRYGDFVGSLGGDMTCPRLVSESPWLCYIDHYRLQCCRSCDKLRKHKNDACEYGDKARWCYSPDYRQDPARCYDDLHICCATCAQLADNSRIGCEFGDRASWCSAMHRRECYTPNVRDVTCCVTCQRKRVATDSGCEYGDRTAWCALIEARQCYKQHAMCCSTCRSHQSSVAGCRYGDRIRECSLANCRRSSYWLSNCCRTCRALLPANTSSPTEPVNAPTQTPTKPPTTTISPDDCRDHASWCKTSPSMSCYANQRVCCHTCQSRKTAHRDCLYGDKNGRWCTENIVSSENCDNAEIRDYCCTTCRQLADPTGRCVDRYSWCPRYSTLCLSSSSVVKEECCRTCRLAGA